MTAADLASYEVEWVTPVATTYRGWTVTQLPPNGQGIGTLEMLNIMENFPLDKMAPYSADTLHINLEPQKLAFQD